ncbi:unnamed protein product [Leuciscus chuanchicus]
MLSAVKQYEVGGGSALSGLAAPGNRWKPFVGLKRPLRDLKCRTAGEITPSSAPCAHILTSSDKHAHTRSSGRKLISCAQKIRIKMLENWQKESVPPKHSQTYVSFQECWLR